MIDVSTFKAALLKKQDELDQEISALQADGREGRTAEVEDPIDVVTSNEAQTAAFQIGSELSDIRAAVEDALRRIADGSYGVCIDCGRDIGEARLKAVPWTPYCIEDQEKHDRERQAAAEDDQLQSAS